MDPIRKRQWNCARIFARVLAAFVACLLISQVALAGAVTATVNDGVGASVICATPDASGAKNLPGKERRSHHDLCCIIHCCALGAPPLKTQASLAPIAVPATRIASKEAIIAPAQRLEPKCAPQSPRAPPVIL